MPGNMVLRVVSICAAPDQEPARTIALFLSPRSARRRFPTTSHLKHLDSSNDPMAPSLQLFPRPEKGSESINKRFCFLSRELVADQGQMVGMNRLNRSERLLPVTTPTLDLPNERLFQCNRVPLWIPPEKCEPFKPFRTVTSSHNTNLTSAR